MLDPTVEKLSVLLSLARKEQRALGSVLSPAGEATVLWDLVVHVAKSNTKVQKSLDEYIIHLARTVGQLEHLKKDNHHDY